MYASQFRILGRIQGRELPLLLPAQQLPSYLAQAAAVVSDPRGFSLEIQRIGGNIEDVSVTFSGVQLSLEHSVHAEPFWWGGSQKVVLPAEVIASQIDLAALLIAEDGSPAVVTVEVRVQHDDPEILERISRLPRIQIEVPDKGYVSGDEAENVLYEYLRGDVTIQLLLCSDADVLTSLGFHKPIEGWFDH